MIHIRAESISASENGVRPLPCKVVSFFFFNRDPVNLFNYWPTDVLPSIPEQGQESYTTLIYI